MNAAWNQRVSQYLDQLETASESIDLLLDDMRISTTQVQHEQLDESTKTLLSTIDDLAKLIQKRETLLHDADAPAHGLTLVDKLLSTHHIEDARMAKRCQKVAATVETTHERAVALFVCQYHLTNLSSDLVRLLSGERTPPTYSKGQSNHRGGLFNEAA